MQFKALTYCRIDLIKAEDLLKLSDQYIELKDIFSMIKLHLKNKVYIPIDYFPFQKKFLNLETHEEGETDREMQRLLLLKI